MRETSLSDLSDDFVVVLYGEGDVSYWSIPLTGFTTDSRGYFLMSAVSVLPKAQFQFADGKNPGSAHKHLAFPLLWLL